MARHREEGIAVKKCDKVPQAEYFGADKNSALVKHLEAMENI